MKHICIVMLSAAALSGCVVAPPLQPVWTPTQVDVTSSLVTGSVTPLCDSYSCKGFITNLKNNTSKPVEIDWNKSYYLRNGQTYGGLMTEGVVFAQRNDVRAPDMILGSGNYSKSMWPSNNMSLQLGTSQVGWVTQGLYSGTHGIFLTIRQGQVEEQLVAQMKLHVDRQDPSPDGEQAQGTPLFKLPSINMGGINLMNGDAE